MVQSSYEQWVRQGKAPLDRYRMDVSQRGDYRIFLAANEEEAAKTLALKAEFCYTDDNYCKSMKMTNVLPCITT